MIELRSIYKHDDRHKLLWDLLNERTEDQAISHRKMPTLAEHCEFVESRPYRAWYFIEDGKQVVGSVYLSNQREIGIFVFNRHQGKGYGEQAVKTLMAKWPGKFYANINPRNIRSHAFFERMGFKPLQVTYAHEDCR